MQEIRSRFERIDLECLQRWLSTKPEKKIPWMDKILHQWMDKILHHFQTMFLRPIVCRYLLESFHWVSVVRWMDFASPSIQQLFRFPEFLNGALDGFLDHPQWLPVPQSQTHPRRDLLQALRGGREAAGGLRRRSWGSRARQNPRDASGDEGGAAGGEANPGLQFRKFQQLPRSFP